MLFEATFISLIFLAWKRAGQGKGMNPKRQEVYESAMEHLSDTTKLRQLADQFEKFGCEVEANMLRLRADYRDLPQETKLAYREAYQKAMTAETLKDGSPMTPEFLDNLAYKFEAITAIGSAQNLRERARDLRKARIDAKKRELETAAKIRENETKRAVEESKKPETEVTQPINTKQPLEAKAEVVSNIPKDAQPANAEVHGE